MILMESKHVLEGEVADHIAIQHEEETLCVVLHKMFLCKTKRTTFFFRDKKTAIKRDLSKSDIAKDIYSQMIPVPRGSSS